MSEGRHSTEEHSSLISTPKQLVIVIVLAFAVPVVVISLLVHLVTTNMRVTEANPGLSEEAIAKRLKPVGDVAIMSKEEREAKLAAEKKAAAEAPKPEAIAKAPAGTPAPAAKAEGAQGKSVYDSACAACHTAGVAGAPKLGDNATWAARLKSGMDTLYASALKGKGAMPPKGGNPSLADADVRAAVDFMVSQGK
ncbi:MAG: c-type cytochrome [Betaproteobacteria bacterium]